MIKLKNVVMRDTEKLSERITTRNGYLRAPANFSRTGIYKYTGSELGIIDEPNRIFNIFRPSDEVFNDESMASFADLPVTLGHPPEMLSTINTKLYSVGYSGSSVEQLENFVKGELTIVDQHAIDAVNKGMSEISLGYICDYEEISGETMAGEPFDLIQRKIRGNHIAIVPSGRAGEQCEIYDSQNPIIEGEIMPKKSDGTVKKQLIEAKISNDADVAELVSNNTENTSEIKPDVQDNELSPSTIDGELKGMIDGINERLNKIEQDLCGASNDKCDPEMEDKCSEEAKDKYDAEEVKDYDGEKGMKDQKMQDAVLKMATELAEVREKAKSKFPSISLDGKTPEEIRKEVVIKTFTSENFDSKSNDYIEARFDALPVAEPDRQSYMLSQLSQPTKDNRHQEKSEAQKAFDETKDKYKK